MGTSAQALPSTMSLVDLLNPDPLKEAQKHKLKRLVQSPNSFFMDVKCPGCYNITPVFSHAQTVSFSPPLRASPLILLDGISTNCPTPFERTSRGGGGSARAVPQFGG